MEYGKIEKAQANVSIVGLGSWVFGGGEWGEVDDNMSIRVVEEAVDNGINFIDTAPIYGFGRAEQVVGRALRGKRHKVVLATKCGLERKGKTIRPNLSPGFIREEIENSLRRLRVDYIDLYQCHWPDINTSLLDTFGELNNLVKEGKVRHIGVCNFEYEFLNQSCKIAPIVSNQVEYSILNRGIEMNLLPFCRENKIAVFSYGSLAGGILTGKYQEPPVLSKGDVRSFFYKYYSQRFWEETAKNTLDKLKKAADKHKSSISQVSINWVLSHPEITSCLVGCRTPLQLKENISAAEWKLTKEEAQNLI